jgi:hypothetical protein
VEQNRGPMDENQIDPADAKATAHFPDGFRGKQAPRRIKRTGLVNRRKSLPEKLRLRDANRRSRLDL